MGVEELKEEKNAEVFPRTDSDRLVGLLILRTGSCSDIAFASRQSVLFCTYFPVHSLQTPPICQPVEKTS